MKCLKVVKGLYDYEANTPEELTFKAGEIFHVVDLEDSDWWTVRAQDGATGLVPSNYVDEAPVKGKVITKWDYSAQIEEELSVLSDDVLDLLDDSDPDWWLVRKDHDIGLVPMSYLELESSPAGNHNIFESEEVQVPEVNVAAPSARVPPPLPSLPPVNAGPPAKVAIKKEWAVKTIDAKQKKGGKVMLQVSESEVLVFDPDKKKVVERYDIGELQNCAIDQKDVKLEFAFSSLRVRCNEQGDSADVVGMMNGILAAENAKKFLQNKKAVLNHPPTNARPAAPPQAAPAFAAPHVPPKASYVFHSKEPSEDEDDEDDEDDAPPPPIVGPSPAAARGVAAPAVVAPVVAPSPAARKQSSPGAKVAEALYDFSSEHGDELSLTAGEDLIIIDDSDPEWWLAQKVSKGSQKGLVPASYVHIKEKLSMTKLQENLAEIERKKKEEEEARFRLEQEEQRRIEAEKRAQDLERQRQEQGRVKREQEERQRREEEAKKIQEAEARRRWEEEERRRFEEQERLRREEEERKWREAEERRLREEEERRVRLERENLERARREEAERIQQEAERKRQELLIIEAERIGLQMLERQSMPVPSPQASRKAPEVPPIDTRKPPKDEKEKKKKLSFFKSSKDLKPPQLPTRTSTDVYGSPEKAPPSPIASRQRSLPSIPPLASGTSNSSLFSPSAAGEQPSVPNPLKVRQWSDKTGGFKVYAELVEIVDGKAILHKTNGVKIAVPLEKLSPPDALYALQSSNAGAPPAASAPVPIPRTQQSLATDTLRMIDQQVASKLHEEEKIKAEKMRMQMLADEELARRLQQEEHAAVSGARSQVPIAGSRASTVPAAVASTAPPTAAPRSSQPQTSSLSFASSAAPPPVSHQPSQSAFPNVALGMPPQSGRRRVEPSNEPMSNPTSARQPSQPLQPLQLLQSLQPSQPSQPLQPLQPSQPQQVPPTQQQRPQPAQPQQQQQRPQPAQPQQQHPNRTSVAATSVWPTSQPSHAQWTAFPSTFDWSSQKPQATQPPQATSFPTTFSSQQPQTFPTSFPTNSQSNSQAWSSTAPQHPQQQPQYQQQQQQQQSFQQSWQPAQQHPQQFQQQQRPPAAQQPAWANASPDNPFGIPSAAPKATAPPPAASFSEWSSFSTPMNGNPPAYNPHVQRTTSAAPFQTSSQATIQPQMTQRPASSYQPNQQSQRPAFYQPVPLQQQMSEPDDPYSAFRNVDPSAPSIIHSTQNNPGSIWGQPSQQTPFGGGQW